MRIHQIIYITTIATVVYACNGSEAANDKKAELQALKEQKKELETKITGLEKELIASGEIKKKGGNSVLVTAITMKPETFTHKVEVRGAVASRKNVQISAEAMGKIDAILVKEGSKVKKGQLLVQLDASILRNNISEVRTQLELATTIYDRQANLWEKNIGTEVQYLQAKNNKESLEKKLETLKSQLDQYNVSAPFSGVVDNVPVRVGEMTQPGMPLLRLVNQEDTYISADISEAFLGRFKEGQEVEVYFPSQDKKVVSEIASIGQVINLENRTFEMEVNLPDVGFPVKPNQVVVLNMVDYTNNEALVVPTKIVQRDSKGNYVYQLIDKGNSKVAKKVYVEPGVTYEQATEIKSGLSEGHVVAYEGYRELAEDVAVTIKK